MTPSARDDAWQTERREWIDSLRQVLRRGGQERVLDLLRSLQLWSVPFLTHPPLADRTPYLNSIDPRDEPAMPGDRTLEARLEAQVRWNAAVMVIRANREFEGIGGHLSTFASTATLLEVGQNHFFRGKDHPCGGDMIYFQGHASPGVYARSFVEGRFDVSLLHRFRRESGSEPGLSSYPHPRLMPRYWEFPTVSMGLGPISAIYQARFTRYLVDRGAIPETDRKVWCFVGDGECDEPESLAALSLAAREKLQDLVFVVNANLQRLDGPVRGNGKIVQELEARFRGAGWNVVKVLWNSAWDELLTLEHEAIAERMEELVDGDLQRILAGGPRAWRDEFFGARENLANLMADWTDEDFARLGLGGHDVRKIHAAYHDAFHHEGSPTVILAQTVKGKELGDEVEARNVTHQKKTLEEEALREMAERLDLGLPASSAVDSPFVRPDADSPLGAYVRQRRAELGGFLPERRPLLETPFEEIPAEPFQEFLEGSGDREVTTTAVLVRLLASLMRTDPVGETIVPIVPDEARTFGLDALFRQYGIYASEGQLYEPVDEGNLLYYRESREGRILEEGITEAGSMASFLAAGTAYANHGRPFLPMYLFYSMFGFQRVGDLIWAAADARARGFLFGATSGRTTLNGEGLQHQDGHSHLLAYTVPSVRAYDPAFAGELAILVREGMQRLLVEQEDLLYYITLTNEPAIHPPLPEGAEEGVLQGMYAFRSTREEKKPWLHLLGSGSILPLALEAQSLLLERYELHSRVWSVTSYKCLHDDVVRTEHANRNTPNEPARRPYVSRCFGEERGVFVAVSDHVRALAHSIAAWLPGPLHALGTDGFGLSDTRSALREHFEISAADIAFAALVTAMRDGRVEPARVERAARELRIDREHPLALDL